MADLGAINLNPSITYQRTAKTVSGVVTMGGVVKKDIAVRMYLRATGNLIGLGYSKADGTVVVATQFPYEGQAVYMVALDDDTGTSYNAIVFDKVIPV